MKRESFFESESGVSEMVGEMMMVGITVTLFAILAVVVYGVLSHPMSTPILDMSMTKVDSSTVTVQHMGGDSISYGDIAFIANGVKFQPSTSADKGDTNNNNLWNIGETITVHISGITSSTNIIAYDTATNSVIGEFSVG